MRILVILCAFAALPTSVLADALSSKYYELLKVQEHQQRFLKQKQQEARIDLSQFRVNAMGAWRKDLKVPMTKNDGIEILPYRVTKAPS